MGISKNEMRNSKNPYSPPSSPSPQTGSSAVEFDLSRVIAIPFSIFLIAFLVGLPIFVCLTLSWILFDAAGIIHFNFFVLPDYNPLVTCVATTTILVLLAVYRIMINGWSK